VLVGVEVGAHQQRVRGAERQRERHHPPLRPRPRLPRRRGRGISCSLLFRRRPRRAGSLRPPPMAHRAVAGEQLEVPPARRSGERRVRQRQIGDAVVVHSGPFPSS
jgi:hypothetical protein